MIKEIKALLKFGYSVHFEPAEDDDGVAWVEIMDESGEMIDAVDLPYALDALREALEQAKEREANKSEYEGQELAVEVLNSDNICYKGERVETGSVLEIVVEDGKIYSILETDDYEFTQSAKEMFETVQIVLKRRL